MWIDGKKMLPIELLYFLSKEHFFRITSSFPWKQSMFVHAFEIFIVS